MKTIEFQRKLFETRELCTPRQLFIDISTLVVTDQKTGIQRVVRSVLLNLLENNPEGLTVEPVYFVRDEQRVFYHYARQFTRIITGSEEKSSALLPDEPIEINLGDIFFGLDLCRNVRHSRNFFKQFQQAGGQVYFVVYDLLPLLLPHYFPPKSEKHHNEWMRTVAESDGVLCISRAVADDVKNWLDNVRPIRSQPFRIGWFHLGADIEQSLPTKGFPMGFDEDLATLADATTLLMVGTIEPRKGYSLVLEAFEILWITGTRINLVIVGKQGWLVKKLATRMRLHNKLNPKFFWYQGLSDEALLKLYSNTDGIVMASEGEGFGLPLIEAAQHGCPILARDLPVFREVAGEHAAYFKGNSPFELSKTLKSWIHDLESGTAPQSSEMSWITWKESSSRILKLLIDSENSNWLYRWKKEVSSKQEQTPIKNGTLRTIAVDLTPITNRENGEARVFVPELLRALAKMKQKTRFILLINQSSYKELRTLDCPNIEKVVIINDSKVSSKNGESKKSIEDLLLCLNSWLNRSVKRWKKSIMKRIAARRPDSGNMLQDLKADLLFCPFTSVEFSEPGIPTVSIIYDLQYKAYPDYFGTKEIAYKNRIINSVAAEASLLATTSEYSRQTAINYLNIHPSSIRTCAIRMTNQLLVNSGKNDEDINTLLARLGIEKGAFLLYPADFHKHNNHEMLLKAFNIAIRNGLAPTLKLVCTGSPDERRQMLIEITRISGIEQRVIFLGYLQNNDLALLMSGCCGLVFPSIYDNAGLSVIAAMQAGVAVACSKTCSLPEISATAALLFDPENPAEMAEAMIALAEDSILRKKLIDAGRLRAAEFADGERMAQEYWQLFEDAIRFRPALPYS
jgi:glycosyltransferase involved in cell wall biosynthesis